MRWMRITFFLLIFLTTSPAFAKNIIYSLQIEDTIIQPVIAEYIEEGIEQAKRDKAQALLIQLNTPGGLLQSTRVIVQNILNAPLPVIVYVTPSGARAASAGTFITLAAHVAAMAPSTHIGAAHPVELGEQVAKEGAMSDKILNDTLAWAQDIAKARKRNVAWMEEAVKKSRSTTAEEALQAEVIDYVAADTTELLKKLDGRILFIQGVEYRLETENATLTPLPMSWKQSILSILLHPHIAYLLLILGFYGLLFELTHPGSWVPGTVGFISFVFALYALHILPSLYVGIGLTLLGLALFAVELFVTSYGLLSLGGLICLGLGGFFLIKHPTDFLQISFSIVAGTLAGFLFLFGFLAWLVFRTHRQKPMTGVEEMIRSVAEAASDLNLEGKVFANGALWNATADTPIKKGEKVVILRLEHFHLYVRKA